MKNLKTLLVTGGLMGVIMIGASSVQAGAILVGGRTEQATTSTAKPCADRRNENSIFGIMMSSFNKLLSGAGLLVSDGISDDCQTVSTAGLLVSD